MRHILNSLIKTIPLENRLTVLNEMAFINLLTELGFREDKAWTDEENEILKKLCNLAEEHTKHILSKIDEWEKDGKP